MNQASSQMRMEIQLMNVKLTMDIIPKKGFVKNAMEEINAKSVLCIMDYVWNAMNHTAYLTTNVSQAVLKDL